MHNAFNCLVCDAHNPGRRGGAGAQFPSHAPIQLQLDFKLARGTQLIMACITVSLIQSNLDSVGKQALVSRPYSIVSLIQSDPQFKW
jgi:hypothetical protein